MIRTFVFSTIFCVGLCLPRNIPYTDDLGRNKLYPLANAIYSGDLLNCFNKVLKGPTELIGKFEAQCDALNGDNCAGYVAVSHGEQVIVVAFRGSVANQQNEEINETIYVPPVSFVAGKVNPYFFNGFQVLDDAGMKNAIVTVKNQYPNYSIWITGHSLGAAIASVAAAKYAFLNYFLPEKMLLMTFGQPRTGNYGYAKFVDSKIPNAYRVVHRYDWVPQMPPEILYGYFHHATEVWYDNDMKIGDPFKVCKGDEDLSCSETSGHLNSDDHNTYYGPVPECRYSKNAAIRAIRLFK